MRRSDRRPAAGVDALAVLVLRLNRVERRATVSRSRPGQHPGDGQLSPSRPRG
jgi:hypothetical protein